MERPKVCGDCKNRGGKRICELYSYGSTYAERCSHYEEKLKPCPFCGGEAEIKDCGSGTFKIECKNDCIAGNNHFLRKDINILIAAWNQRTN